MKNPIGASIITIEAKKIANPNSTIVIPRYIGLRVKVYGLTKRTKQFLRDANLAKGPLSSFGIEVNEVKAEFVQACPKPREKFRRSGDAEPVAVRGEPGP